MAPTLLDAAAAWRAVKPLKFCESFSAPGVFSDGEGEVKGHMAKQRAIVVSCKWWWGVICLLLRRYIMRAPTRSCNRRLARCVATAS